MLDRDRIEDFLRLNGVDATAPDEEIKSILVSAQWNENDVEAALLVLRENKKSHKTHVDSLHKVFQSDEKMSPEAISALLGVDLDVESIEHAHLRHTRGVSMGQVMQICFLSLFFSILFIVASMWFLEIGIFHVTMR